MLTALGVTAVVVGPPLAIVLLLLLAARVQRSRDEAAAQQIMLTDAIHRELGAVAAPFVRRPLRGPWQVTLALPFARPGLVAAVLAIVHRALARAGGGVEIVVTDQEEPAPPRPRPPALGRARQESVSWT